MLTFMIFGHFWLSPFTANRVPAFRNGKMPRGIHVSPKYQTKFRTQIGCSYLVLFQMASQPAV
jgi:hypothetical protein